MTRPENTDHHVHTTDENEPDSTEPADAQAPGSVSDFPSGTGEAAWAEGEAAAWLIETATRTATEIGRPLSTLQVALLDREYNALTRREADDIAALGAELRDGLKAAREHDDNQSVWCTAYDAASDTDGPPAVVAIFDGLDLGHADIAAGTYCPRCGDKALQNAADQPPRCPSGHLVDVEAAFCPTCGAALPSGPTRSPGAQEGSSGSGGLLRTQAIVAGIVVVVLLALAIGKVIADRPAESPTAYITGSQIAQYLRGHLTEARSGVPIQDVTCPDQRVVTGSSVRCRVTFSDGSFIDTTVTVESVESSGTFDVKLDVAH